MHLFGPQPYPKDGKKIAVPPQCVQPRQLPPHKTPGWKYQLVSHVPKEYIRICGHHCHHNHCISNPFPTGGIAQRLFSINMHFEKHIHTYDTYVYLYTSMRIMDI